MIRKWLHKLFHCGPEYPSGEHQEHIKQRFKEAEAAARQADSQLEKAKEIREESKMVGNAARRINMENHFTARVRRALEGR